MDDTKVVENASVKYTDIINHINVRDSDFWMHVKEIAELMPGGSKYEEIYGIPTKVRPWYKNVQYYLNAFISENIAQIVFNNLKWRDDTHDTLHIGPGTKNSDFIINNKYNLYNLDMKLYLNSESFYELINRMNNGENVGAHDAQKLLVLIIETRELFALNVKGAGEFDPVNDIKAVPIDDELKKILTNFKFVQFNSDPLYFDNFCSYV